MSIRRLLPAAALVAAAGLSPGPALGHDLWIEPDRLTVPAGETVAIALEVGEAFDGEPVARNPRWIDRFAALGPGGETELAGTPGSHPAGRWQPQQPGAYWLLYRSRPSTVTLDAERFESYLAAEGLDHVLAERRASGQQAMPGRERFSRCAKALLRVDPGSEDTRSLAAQPITEPTGLTLDLVPLADPRGLRGGGRLPIRLLYEDRPLAGTLLEAHGPGGRRMSARSDLRGEAVFGLDAAGDWLITAVHMVPATAGSGADWESLWASLRFALPTE